MREWVRDQRGMHPLMLSTATVGYHVLMGSRCTRTSRPRGGILGTGAKPVDRNKQDWYGTREDVHPQGECMMKTSGPSSHLNIARSGSGCRNRGVSLGGTSCSTTPRHSSREAQLKTKGERSALGEPRRALEVPDWLPQLAMKDLCSRLSRSSSARARAQASKQARVSPSSLRIPQSLGSSGRKLWGVAALPGTVVRYPRLGKKRGAGRGKEEASPDTHARPGGSLTVEASAMALRWNVRRCASVFPGGGCTGGWLRGREGYICVVSGMR